MMICPESFYERELKGKAEKEIMNTIRSLKREIEKLKNTIEHPDYVCVMHPSEAVQISCMRGYLERAKEALAEVGGVYSPSKAEQKAAEFDENIENIKKIAFEIGSFFDGWSEYVIELDGEKILFKYSKFFEDLEAKLINKEEFLYGVCGLQNLHIGEWRKYYSTERFGYSVMDGTQWSVKFTYSDDKTIEYGGSNAYPYNFDGFATLFGLKDIKNEKEAFR